MSNPNIIIIHGNGGPTAESLWIPDVKARLEDSGLDVTTETMPDNQIGRSIRWLPFLKNELHAN